MRGHKNIIYNRILQRCAAAATGDLVLLLQSDVTSALASTAVRQASRLYQQLVLTSGCQQDMRGPFLCVMLHANESGPSSEQGRGSYLSGGLGLDMVTRAIQSIQYGGHSLLLSLAYRSAAEAAQALIAGPFLQYLSGTCLSLHVP